jgi:hypothetical protein
MGRFTIEVPPGLSLDEQFDIGRRETARDDRPRIVRWLACWADP